VAIEKSKGQTPTEAFLAELCDRTFLKLWCYANPYKSDGKELCDVLAVFEDHVFVFFDRESRKFDDCKDVEITWERWKREVIQKQINTAKGAKRYILQNSSEIYLDAKLTKRLPVIISPDRAVIHKIVVAHGAEDACKAISDSNIYGSLAISYGEKVGEQTFPFMLFLEKDDPTHVLDSHNLEIILAELDTYYDFTSYLSEKEDAINKYINLAYCGEEDLLAHYLINFDNDKKAHFIGTRDEAINAIYIGEGEWRDFVASEQYLLKKAADKESYLWDRLIQYTCQNALDDKLLGNGDAFNRQSAIYEMAKEPRLWRRTLSEIISSAIERFPAADNSIMRHLSFMPSFFSDTGYVFLQLWHPSIVDYDGDYRPKRQKLLEIACGVAKNKFPQMTKIVGIAIDPPKISTRGSEDFILLNCAEWSSEIRYHYEDENAVFKFFETNEMRRHEKHVREFPLPETSQPLRKVGRNEKCPCGSGNKYKKCCGIG